MPDATELYGNGIAYRSSADGQPVKSFVLKNDYDALSTTGMYGRSRAISP
jgi:hypothetical protein